MTSPTHEQVLRTLANIKRQFADTYRRDKDEPRCRRLDDEAAAMDAGADALASLRSTRRALDVGFDAGADWALQHPDGGMGSQAAMDAAWAQYLAELTAKE